MRLYGDLLYGDGTYGGELPVMSDLQRLPFCIVEIDLDDVTSATAATDPVTGARCYNTPSTSQYWAPLTVGTKTRSFQSRSAPPMDGYYAVPSVESVSWSDDELRFDGLTSFGEVTIILQDHLDDDISEDPYYSSRPTTPGNASYWRRLLARNPYVQRRALRIKWGYWSSTYDAGDFVTRTYEIADIAGPDANGKVAIRGCSPLARSALAKTMVPEPSESRLGAAINSTDLTITLQDTSLITEFSSYGYCRINEEILYYTVTGSTIDVTRAMFGTTASSHEVGDSIQQCVYFNNVTIAAFLYYLVVTYGGVDSSYVPSTDWIATDDAWFSTYSINLCIATSTPIIDLLNQLSEQVGFWLHYDPEEAQIRMIPWRPPDPSAMTTIDDTSILGPVKYGIDISQRVSRCDVLFGLRTPIHDVSNEASYRVRLVGDTKGESTEEYGFAQRKVLHSVFWAYDQAHLAKRGANSQSDARWQGRRTYTCTVPMNVAANVRLGDTIYFTSCDLTDTDGETELTVPCLVVGLSTKPGEEITLTLEPSIFIGRYAYAIAPTTDTYLTTSTRDPAGFACGADGKMSNGDSGYRAH